MNVCRCILSKFYIKPQRLAVEGYSQAVVSYRNSTSNHNTSRSSGLTKRVVSYRNSTSNHNLPRTTRNVSQLYLIEILHQTTTLKRVFCTIVLLYLIEILHQTTTSWNATRRPQSCILSKFYIKPQLLLYPGDREEVVSYRNSTSNHNTDTREKNLRHVVSYRNSTSNHNRYLR